MSQLDHDLRREYDEAYQAVPGLVERESKVERFLKAEDGDPDKAAIRLAKYWKTRKELFKERWLLPMTQTGNGALSMEDIELLRTGYYVVLNRPSGGTIVLFDESRLPRNAGESETRIVFYMSNLYDEPSNITLLHVLTGERRPGFDLQLQGWEIIRTALPVNVVRSRVILAQTYEEGKQELVDYFAYQTDRAVQFRRGRAGEHIAGNSLGHTLSLLQSHGLERECLPRCLGGDFDYSLFNDWVRARLSIEGAMACAPLHANRLHQRCTLPTQPTVATTSRTFQIGSDKKHLHAKELQVATTMKQSTNQGKKPPLDTIGKAKQNKKHVPKLGYYQKQNMEIGSMQSAIKLLLYSNETLRHENRSLEHALAKARLALAQSLSPHSE